MFNWFNAREASEVGVAMADDLVLQTSASGRHDNKKMRAMQGTDLQRFLHRFLQRVDQDARPLKLNIFKRAKLASAFKWRLLEKGMERAVADELTNALVMRLSARRDTQAAGPAPAAPPPRRSSGNAQTLLAQGNDCLARGAYEDAVARYRELATLFPRDAKAHHSLGDALCRLGRYPEAEAAFRRAVGVRAGDADANCSLGVVLAWMGRYAESEASLRRALKLKPTHLEAQVNLGGTLARLGRLAEARALLEKVLRVAPRNVDALVGLGQIAGSEGQFAEAEQLFNRSLEVDRTTPAAWAGLAGLRKMSSTDSAWLKGAEAAATASLPPVHEAGIRYAIGKYFDDAGEYGRAFKSYQRANELQKMGADPYNGESHTRFVDDLIRIYTPEVLARSQTSASDAALPVLVTGMPRSGTTLVEQIIAAHPACKSAGEIDYWSGALRQHIKAPLEEPVKRKLSSAYLRVLGARSGQSQHIIDKTPRNADFLGPIHAVFPNARMVYVQRDPIDTCLSCYFQQFSAALNYTLDLSDLAHYYREHVRLVRHWRRVLAPSAMLFVPYAELISDQEGWSRKIIEFLGLEWDARCLQFHDSKQPILTASFWQARQRLYRDSVGRWRNYEKFVGPLLSLRDLTP